MTRAFTTVLCLYIVFTSLPAHAVSDSGSSALCQPTSVDLRPGIPGGTKIQFPSGRSITVVGINHGDLPTLSSIAVMAGDSKSNSTAYVNQLQTIFKDRATIVDANLVKSYLQETLAKPTSGIEFVAVEFPQELIDDQQKALQSLRENLLREFSRRRDLGLDNPEQFRDQLALVSGGAAVYLKGTNPGLFSGKKLIGTDGYSQLMTAQLLSDTRDQRCNVLAPTLDDEHRQRVKSAIDWFDSNSQKVPPAPNDGGFSQLITREVPDAYRSEAELCAKATLNFARNMNDRNKAMAKNLLQQPGSGIQIIGASHAPALLEMLEASCNQQMGQGRTSAPPSQSPNSVKVLVK